MLNSESKLWDLKYSKSMDHMSVDDYLFFSKENPTISALIPYIKEGMSIFEIGSGTGELISYIQYKYPKVKTYGYDYSRVSIERSQKMASRFNLPVNFIEGDICDMKFDNDRFDIIFGDQVIGHVDDMNKALNEIKRVLKPGGLCFLSTVNRLRFDGWDLYKKISSSHEGYTQRSFYPRQFKSMLNKSGMLFQFGYGDMLILFRNFKILKNTIFGQKKIVTSENNKNISNSKKINTSFIKKVYNYLDYIFPWFLKISIGVVVKKHEN